MSGAESDCLFLVDPDCYDPENGFILLTVWQNTDYAVTTDFYCGHDFELAQEYVAELNLSRGHTVQFSTNIIELIAGLSGYKFFNA